MTSDLLFAIVHHLSAAPNTHSHDHLNVTVYENGLATSSSLIAPVLSDSGLAKACVIPRIFVAIRSVEVHAAIRWPTMIPYQIVDSLQEALVIIGGCQVVFCRSELALLVSADSAQDIITLCRYHNDEIRWAAVMALDVQTRPTASFQNVPADPLEQYINYPIGETAINEFMAQQNDFVNNYDGPLFDDWNSLAYPPGCDLGSSIAESHNYSMSLYLPPPGVYPVEYSALDTLSHDISVTLGEPTFQFISEYQANVAIDSFEDAFNSPSPSSTRSSPFPETPAFENFRSDLPHIVSPPPTVARDGTNQEEQQDNKATQIVHQSYPTSPASAVDLSPLSQCDSLPFSRCSSASPSSQSSGRDSTSPIPGEGSFQAPVRAVGKKIRRARAGGIRKKKTKSKEKHFCCYCSESFTRDHDADRHQRTCKFNPNCSQKEQCKVCGKPLPVRLDARRRHWGTLECSDAARKRGFIRMDEEVYELL